MMRVAIVGGGIAGLSAAYYLSKQAREHGMPLSITVLEAEARWGGKIHTQRTDGFVIEGGPDTFLASKSWGIELCRELGLEDRLHGTNPLQNKTYVLHRGQLQPLPEGLAMMIPTRLSPMLQTRLLTWGDKLRMGLDYLLPAPPLDGDESLGAFVSRRLGRSVYERLVEPLMSGIYAGDGDRLSLGATFPYLRDLELQYGGLIRGALAMRARRPDPGLNPTGARSIFQTLTSGLAEIIEALVAALQAAEVNLRTGVGVQKVQIRHPTRLAGGFGGESTDMALKPVPTFRLVLQHGEALAADGLVLATPAYAAGDLLVDLDPALAAELRSIEYVSTATVSLVFPQHAVPHPLDGYGYVIPRREVRQALACTWTSTKFPHRAPEGYVLLRVFAGRAGQEDQLPSDGAGLLELARCELRDTLGISSPPLLYRAFLWPNAMPQYNLGHPQRLMRIAHGLERWPNLALAGNGYRGIGIPDCIASGHQAAHRLLACMMALTPQKSDHNP